MLHACHIPRSLHRTVLSVWQLSWPCPNQNPQVVHYSISLYFMVTSWTNPQQERSKPSDLSYTTSKMMLHYLIISNGREWCYNSMFTCSLWWLLRSRSCINNNIRCVVHTVVHYSGVGLIHNKHSLILPPSKRREDIHPPPSEEWCLIMEVWVLYSKLQNMKMWRTMILLTSTGWSSQSEPCIHTYNRVEHSTSDSLV